MSCQPAPWQRKSASNVAVCSETVQFIYFKAERFGFKDMALKLKISFLLQRNIASNKKIDIYIER